MQDSDHAEEIVAMTEALGEKLKELREHNRTMLKHFKDEDEGLSALLINLGEQVKGVDTMCQLFGTYEHFEELRRKEGRESSARMPDEAKQYAVEKLQALGQFFLLTAERLRKSIDGGSLQCDNCDEPATEFYPALREPVQFCVGCEYDARRSGWEPGQ